LNDVIRSASCCDEIPATATLRVDAARQRIIDTVQPITSSEKLTLRNALSRVLAEDIISPLNVPGHTNSAMDGYALSGADLPQSEAQVYQVIGKSFAGAPFNGRYKARKCVPIRTGHSNA